MGVTLSRRCIVFVDCGEHFLKFPQFAAKEIGIDTGCLAIQSTRLLGESSGKSINSRVEFAKQVVNTIKDVQVFFPFAQGVLQFSKSFSNDAHSSSRHYHVATSGIRRYGPCADADLLQSIVQVRSRHLGGEGLIHEQLLVPMISFSEVGD